jgi:hypothetical protein
MDRTDAMGSAEFQCKCSCGRSYSLGHSISDVHSDVEHESHQCDAQYCPIPCQLCKRLCSSPNHLHALEAGAIHLCGYVIRWCASPLRERNAFRRKPHTCSQRCTAHGVCEIDTAPESIEETFKGMHECFQYTKVRLHFPLRRFTH